MLVGGLLRPVLLNIALLVQSAVLIPQGEPKELSTLEARGQGSKLQGLGVPG